MSTETIRLVRDRRATLSKTWCFTSTLFSLGLMAVALFPTDLDLVLFSLGLKRMALFPNDLDRVLFSLGLMTVAYVVPH